MGHAKVVEEARSHLLVRLFRTAVEADTVEEVPPVLALRALLLSTGKGARSTERTAGAR